MTFEEGVMHLTSHFYNMLKKAEEMFGDRDKTWTFIGIQFFSDGPYIMYHENKNISIVLSTGCSNTIPTHPQLYYQLSHEVCHLLYPTGKKDANVLNEGISTYFSKIYLDRIFPENSYALDNISKSRYYRAYQLVEKLLKDDPEAIKKIRAVNAELSYITEEQLKSLNFNISDDEIKELVSRF